MRRLQTRRRRDGLCEVVRVGLLRRGAVALGIGVLGLPVVAVFLLELIMALPIVVFFIPPAVVGAVVFGTWWLRQRCRRSPGRQPGRVVLLRRAG